MPRRTARSDPPPLTRREREIMDVLFAHRQATVADILASLSDPPSYSAVRATLKTLVDKGHAHFREDGPRYLYLPAVPPDAARDAALQHVVRTFFDGSSEDAIVALLRTGDTQISPVVVERLTRQIQKVRKEGR